MHVYKTDISEKQVYNKYNNTDDWNPYWRFFSFENKIENAEIRNSIAVSCIFKIFNGIATNCI